MGPAVPSVLLRPPLLLRTSFRDAPLRSLDAASATERCRGRIAAPSLDHKRPRSLDLFQAPLFSCPVAPSVMKDCGRFAFRDAPLEAGAALLSGRRPRPRGAATISTRPHRCPPFDRELSPERLCFCCLASIRHPLRIFLAAPAACPCIRPSPSWLSRLVGRYVPGHGWSKCFEHLLKLLYSRGI